MAYHVDNGVSRGLTAAQRMAERQALETRLVRIVMALPDEHIERVITVVENAIARADALAEVATW